MDNNKISCFDDLVEAKAKRTSGAANLKFNEEVKRLVGCGRSVFHFGFGQSPFPVPDAFVRALRNNAHSNSYLPIQGTLELRESLSRFHLKYDGLSLDPRNFVVGPGSKELIFLTLIAFNGVVLLTSPTWTTYEQQCHLAGKVHLVLRTHRGKGWKVTPETILEGLELLSSSCRNEYKLLILTSPGNPSGTCYTAEELQDISVCCRENKILVLSDEIYARLVFDGRHHSMAKFYPEGTIMSNGISKWASAGGWRLGYVYFPPQLRTMFDAVCNCVSSTYSCAPAPMQDAVAYALRQNEEELESYIHDCKAILKLAAHFCYRELESVGVTGHASEGGYYYMPDFEVVRKGLAKRGVFTGDQMTKLMLEEADVALMSTSAFLRPEKELSVRFCFICFDGTLALESYKALKGSAIELEASNEAGRRFLEQNCPNLVQGVKRLKEWVVKYS